MASLYACCSQSPRLYTDVADYLARKAHSSVCAPTCAAAGKLFPGPHLYAGAAITVLWAVAAALVPQMQVQFLLHQQGKRVLRWCCTGAVLVMHWCHAGRGQGEWWAGACVMCAVQEGRVFTRPPFRSQAQKGNEAARNAHIALNCVNILLFAWQVGWPG